jgi:hypothetical protein
MMMRTRRTMQAKALQTNRLTCIDPGCMIIVINEIESNVPQSYELENSSIWSQWLVYMHVCILHHGRTISRLRLAEGGGRNTSG